MCSAKEKPEKKTLAQGRWAMGRFLLSVSSFLMRVGYRFTYEAYTHTNISGLRHSQYEDTRCANFCDNMRPSHSIKDRCVDRIPVRMESNFALQASECGMSMSFICRKSAINFTPYRANGAVAFTDSSFRHSSRSGGGAACKSATDNHPPGGGWNWKTVPHS